MKLTEKYFNKLKERKNESIKNIGYMYQLWQRYKEVDKNIAYTIYKRTQRMENCLSYWKWDFYRENKVMNLKIVKRCKDLFCPNCRNVSMYKAIKNFYRYFFQLIERGFMPCLMTLTVPNIKREYLKEEIENINNAFIQLWRWLYRPFKENGKYGGGYKDRLFDAVGAVKAVEVTVQKSDWDYFNLHLHVMIFIDGYSENYFIKHIPGGYQRRTNSYIFYSDADTFIQKLWTMAYGGKKIFEFCDVSDNWEDNYICDIRELSIDGGLYEVFKYCFKDTDIKSLDIFEDLLFGLKGKRLRQGYGELYNAKLDDYYNDDCIENYLEFKDEIPEVLINKYIDDMNEKYGDYKKVSIHKS